MFVKTLGSRRRGKRDSGRPSFEASSCEEDMSDMSGIQGGSDVIKRVLDEEILSGKYICRCNGAFLGVVSGHEL